MAAIIMLGRRLSTRFRRKLDVLSDDGIHINIKRKNRKK
jgi:hypothetical protein